MPNALRATADLCDQREDEARVLAPDLRDFGGVTSFAGPARTLRVYEDNALVRAALDTPGEGAVLVIDGRGSLRTALVGGHLAALAERNGWAGIVAWGAVRDAAELRHCQIGIRALGTCPRKSAKQGTGAIDVPVTIGGIEIAPGQWVVADEDGVVVVDRLDG